MSNIKCQISNKISSVIDHWILDIRYLTFSQGFTLAEILVAVSIMSVIAAVGIVSVSRYNERQSLRNGALAVREMFNSAKSKAASNIKPAECVNPLRTLEGYSVLLCSKGGVSCKTSGTDYELNVVCSSVPFLVGQGKSLPRGITFTAGGTNSVFFKILNGGIVGSGTVGVTGYGNTMNMTIDAQGNITLNE